MVCMYVCMYVCTYICMYVCIYVCMYACMYACMCVCLMTRKLDNLDSLCVCYETQKPMKIIQWTDKITLTSMIWNTKVLLRRAAHRIPDLRERIRALPREINMGDLFTGTGCFNKVFMQLFDTIQNVYPEECEDLEVVWFGINIAFFSWICLVQSLFINQSMIINLRNLGNESCSMFYYSYWYLILYKLYIWLLCFV